ncbi:pantoate--beta-alanine ligase [Exiguobacterium oxidotolerans]|uniref:Pantothenate synthetase n=1 Tax=Exiguobacterium oxidotolerans TaxID=223958 RepID=A0A653IEI6_9BACL|nr:pantoate--beta-alanine ligase [Exiguobacterium oxidotolerans]VWX37038.1 pantothenate synthetase [Exiguobacterium oxidotolerans]
MKVIQDIDELRQELAAYDSIGFVPTMGFLHEGHGSLLERARRENEIVVLSIFVNPTQFGPNEDLERYPRDEQRDQQLARAAGVDYVFYPTNETMYPLDMARVMVRTGDDVLCGASRPGHFDGVLTVVSKLLNIVRPTRAYFGLKDAQQLALIEGYVADYFVPVEIKRCPIIREADGLAKSSRNVYLSEQERSQAPRLQQALQQANALLEAGTAVEEVVERTKDALHLEGTALDYVEAVDYPTLGPVTAETKTILLAVAVQFESARLIDNLLYTRGA